MESQDALYVTWRGHYRHAIEAKPEDLSNFYYTGRRHETFSQLACSEFGHDLLYLARKKWPAVVDDLQLLNQVDGWLRNEKQQAEKVEGLKLSSVIGWLKADLGLPADSDPRLEEFQRKQPDYVAVSRSDNGGFILELTKEAKEKRAADYQEKLESLPLFNKHRGRGPSFGDPNPPENLPALADPIGAFLEELDEWTDAENSFNKIAIGKGDLSDSDAWELMAQKNKKFSVRNSLQSMADDVATLIIEAGEDPKIFFELVHCVGRAAPKVRELKISVVAVLRATKVKLASNRKKQSEANSQSVVEVSDGKTTGRRTAKQKAGGRNPKLKLTSEEKQVKELWNDGKGKFTRHNQLDDYLDQDAGYVKKLLDNIKRWERRKRERSTKSTK